MHIDEELRKRGVIEAEDGKTIRGMITMGGMGGLVGPALGIAGAAVGIGVLAAGTNMIAHEIEHIAPDAEKKLRER